jgi:hypothetical protein
VQRVAKNNGRDLQQCNFGISHEAYRKAVVIVNEPNTPANQKRLIIK